MKTITVSLAVAATAAVLAPVPAQAQATGQGIDVPGSATTGPRVGLPVRPTSMLSNIRSGLSKAAANQLTRADEQKYRALWQTQDAERIADFLVTRAKDGHVWAMREAGAFYGGQNGLANHPLKSLYWYHEAAALGDTRSAMVIGTAYARGVVLDQDKEMARFWLEQAKASDDRRTKQDAAKLLAAL